MRRVMKMIAGGGLSITGSHTMCGDYLYSGHTVMLTLTYLFIKECKFHWTCTAFIQESFPSKPLNEAHFIFLKEKFVILHIKLYKKDIYDHTKCSSAFLWQPAQLWELELVAGITAKKTTEDSDNPSKNTINAHFKRRETRRMFSGVLPCANTNAKLNTDIYPETAVCLFREADERAAFVFISLFSFVF